MDPTSDPKEVSFLLQDSVQISVFDFRFSILVLQR